MSLPLIVVFLCLGIFLGTPVLCMLVELEQNIKWRFLTHSWEARHTIALLTFDAKVRLDAHRLNRQITIQRGLDAMWDNDIELPMPEMSPFDAPDPVHLQSQPPRRDHVRSTRMYRPRDLHPQQSWIQHRSTITQHQRRSHSRGQCSQPTIVGIT